MKVDHHRLGVRVSVAGSPFQPLPDALAEAALREWPAEARADLHTRGQAVSPLCPAVVWMLGDASGQQSLPL